MGIGMSMRANARVTVGSPANRWVIAAAAAAVMLTIGTLYSWAIFTQPLLAAFRWDLTVTTGAYATANFSLAALGAVLGGFWQDRAGPRRVALTGISLWGMGNVLAGIGTPAFGAPWLYATYGLMGGLGAGMAYITPLSMVARWFPDRRGLVGGLIAGAFGLGAVIYCQWVPHLAGFHAATLHASHLPAGEYFTDQDSAAVMNAFILSGIVFLVIGLPAASLFRNPVAPGADRRTDEPAALEPAISGEISFSPAQMLAMPQFYLIWLQLLVNVIGGVTLISNGVLILTELTKTPAVTLGPLLGLISSFNVIGRCLWGAVSDRIGCRRTFVAMFLLQAATMLVLGHLHDLRLALAAFAVMLLCCGGGFGTMPSYAAWCFGTRYMGRNYGLILTAWGVAGLIGPIALAQLRERTGSFGGTLATIAAILAVAVILPVMTRRPSRPAETPADRSPGEGINGTGLALAEPV